MSSYVADGVLWRLVVYLLLCIWAEPDESQMSENYEKAVARCRWVGPLFDSWRETGLYREIFGPEGRLVEIQSAEDQELCAFLESQEDFQVHSKDDYETAVWCHIILFQTTWNLGIWKDMKWNTAGHANLSIMIGFYLENF